MQVSMRVCQWEKSWLDSSWDIQSEWHKVPNMSEHLIITYCKHLHQSIGAPQCRVDRSQRRVGCHPLLRPDTVVGENRQGKCGKMLQKVKFDWNHLQVQAILLRSNSSESIHDHRLDGGSPETLWTSQLRFLHMGYVWIKVHLNPRQPSDFCDFWIWHPQKNFRWFKPSGQIINIQLDMCRSSRWRPETPLTWESLGSSGKIGKLACLPKLTVIGFMYCVLFLVFYKSLNQKHGLNDGISGGIATCASAVMQWRWEKTCLHRWAILEMYDV